MRSSSPEKPVNVAQGRGDGPADSHRLKFRCGPSDSVMKSHALGTPVPPENQLLQAKVIPRTPKATTAPHAPNDRRT